MDGCWAGRAPPTDDEGWGGRVGGCWAGRAPPTNNEGCIGSAGRLNDDIFGPAAAAQQPEWAIDHQLIRAVGQAGAQPDRVARPATSGRGGIAANGQNAGRGVMRVGLHRSGLGRESGVWWVCMHLQVGLHMRVRRSLCCRRRRAGRQAALTCCRRRRRAAWSSRGRRRRVRRACAPGRSRRALRRATAACPRWTAGGSAAAHTDSKQVAAAHSSGLPRRAGRLARRLQQLDGWRLGRGHPSLTWQARATLNRSGSGSKNLNTRSRQASSSAASCVLEWWFFCAGQAHRATCNW